MILYDWLMNEMNPFECNPEEADTLYFCIFTLVVFYFNLQEPLVNDVS